MSAARDVEHSREAASEEDILSVIDFAKKSQASDSRSCPESVFAEVLRLSKKETAPLLGNLKRISLGAMFRLQALLEGDDDDDNNNNGISANSAPRPAVGSKERRPSSLDLLTNVAGNTNDPDNKGRVEAALEDLGLTVHDRPYVEAGPKLGLNHTDVDLTGG